MYIVFESIKWKNFLSTGNNFTEIKLNRSKNTLIVGSNGAGKSTLLDALCFLLFGKAFRNINKPNLINSVNQNNCVVEGSISIGKKNYRIVRGIKPNIFEIYCNGVLLNQDSTTKDYQELLEKHILKFNYKSFTQIVILGSASFVPFMQLKAADRRTIIEDLLDIQIFSSMNILVKDKISSIKDNIKNNKFEMELIAEKITLQKRNIEENKTHNDEEIEAKRDEIKKNEERLSILSSKIDALKMETEELEKSVSDEKKVRDKSKKLIQMQSKIKTNFDSILSEIKFFSDNDHCPTCTQAIDEEFKQKKTSDKSNKIIELKEGLSKIETEIEKNNNRINEINSIWKQIIKNGNQCTDLNATIRTTNEYITKQNKDIEKLLYRKENIEGGNTHLNELKTQLDVLVKDQINILEEKNYYDLASTLLKDTGIKTKIIKQYLPTMNKLINKYLAAMDFFVNFNIDENFEETIKSRYRDEFSYANFSEGEKMRIDLALLFTWREIAKLKNSTSTNLLILDEVFDSSLDTVGTEEFMKLINELGTESNVFVISHKGDQLYDKFRSLIKFEKKNNFSRIVK